MNSYYALMLDVTDDNRLIRYGYTFKEKDIFHARLHAREVAIETGMMPLPEVWRISHDQYVRLLEKYTVPTAYAEDLEASHEAA
jgi:hypothetical protein